MSQENVEIVRRVYAEVSAGIWTAPPALFDTEYEVDLSDAAPDVGIVRGREAAEAALRGYLETFDDFRIELVEVVHAEERCVITAIRDGGRPKGSNSEVWNHFFHVWTFRKGRIVRRSSHVERAAALEAAGLTE